MVSEKQSIHTTEILILGTGVAGLATALKLADHHKVTLIAKCGADGTNSAMAQGGIASVIAIEDDFAQHIEDTLAAGAGLCHREVVEKVVSTGPERILELEKWGVNFDTLEKPEHQGKNLHREGGHSQRRILHVQDYTGRAIHNALIEKARLHPNIEILENLIALDLITSHHSQTFRTGANHCLGCYFLDIEKQSLVTIHASTTVLATGGAGKTYLYTSNWDGATGDGIAMAWRAGCRVANMEFMQFHPTCLYHQKARNFLISEALRGEGAELVNENGEAFTWKHDPAGPLAPRDRVARAIDEEMKTTGAECVYLDIRHRGREFLTKQFPVIFDRCLSLGFDLSQDLLPVVPAAHYLCGGVLTDENGHADLPGLYVVGESANTGLHGANRLASNSLLECLAFAHFASEKINEEWDQVSRTDFPEVSTPEILLHKKGEDELMLVTHLWDEIRTCMWNYVGIVRSDQRLARALTRIRNIETEISQYYKQYQINSDLIELRNLATVARLTIECAIRRPSSVGTHYNVNKTPADLSNEPKLNILHPNELS